MRLGKGYLAAALLLAAWAGMADNCLASAWGQVPGGLFVSLQPYYYQTSDYFDGQGHRRGRGGSFTKWEVNPYMEYGLGERDTISCNLYYDWLSDDAGGGEQTNQGLADQELGWQHRLYRSQRSVAAVQGLFIVPAGYGLEDSPPLGYARFGAELNLRYGLSFQAGGNDGYVDLRTGLRQYFGYPATQVRGEVNAGYDLGPSWQLLIQNELHYGLDNGEDKILADNSAVAANYRLLKSTLGLRYRLDSRYSLVAAAFQHLWGEDAGAGGGAYVALWFQH